MKGLLGTIACFLSIFPAHYKQLRTRTSVQVPTRIEVWIFVWQLEAIGHLALGKGIATMHRTTLVQLSLWATCVQAFYPYIPLYACDRYHDCGDHDKRSTSADNRHGAVTRSAEAGELLTFKLTQRSIPVSPNLENTMHIPWSPRGLGHQANRSNSGHPRYRGGSSTTGAAYEAQVQICQGRGSLYTGEAGQHLFCVDR